MRRALILLAATAVLATPMPAGAQSTSTKLSNAQHQLSRLKSDYERVGAAYARLETQRGLTSNRLSATQAAIAKTQADVTSLRDKLKTRIRAAYMMRGVGIFEFLLSAKNFREFGLRYMVLEQQSLADEGSLLTLRKKTAELHAQRAELDRENQSMAAQTAELVDQGSHMTVSLEQANRLVRALQGQLKLEQLQKLFHITTYRGNGTIVAMDYCPVAGPHYVTNSFGDPRPGGRRHQGNDIMSPKGTPVVAAVSGTVSMRTGGLGGNAYLLQGSNALFYYAHLNDFVVADGATVKAGQLIGHNGNTGDAAGGPDHVHFEIHPGQGWTQAIDPYPSLSQVC